MCIRDRLIEQLNRAMLYRDLIVDFVNDQDIGELRYSPLAAWLMHWEFLEQLPHDLLPFVFPPTAATGSEQSRVMLGVRLATKLGVKNALLRSADWTI